MNRGAIVKWRTVLPAVAVCVVASQPASAQSIQVRVRDCASGVHLTAQQARLSEVLGRLSEELGFELQFGGDEDPLITTDTTAPALELVKRLRGAESVIVGVAPNPRCPGQALVTAVWVIGGGTGSAPMPPLRTGAQIEAERRAREATEMYLRAHGMDPALADSQ